MKIFLIFLSGLFYIASCCAILFVPKENCLKIEERAFYNIDIKVCSEVKD